LIIIILLYMNDIPDKDLLNSANKINKLYDKLGYFDLYGSSVVLFMIVTLFVTLVYLYCVAMTNAQAIKDDWSNQRCNPNIIPFAGFINKPNDQSITDYTGENFNYCIQNVLANITGFALQPFTFLINFLTTVFDQIQKAINTIRDVINKLREDMRKIAEEILSRILNMLIPLQVIFIGLKDILNKVQGILTAALYTSLGSYYTLKALMGAIAEMIIVLLIIFAAIIVSLWLVPFTFPVAAANTLIFVAISVPLTIIVLFMTEVLHIQTEGVPGVPSCFDKNTLLKMNNGSYQTIENIKVGQVLYNNSKVTAKIRVNAKGLTMYKLNNIIVSGSHILKYKDKWIPVRLHPDRVPIPYLEPYLYCLNTTSKLIVINNMVFTDWDEIYETKLENILQRPFINEAGFMEIVRYKENIHKLCNGFIKGTLFNNQNGLIPIEQVNVGDKIGEDIVYGVVEFDGSHLSNSNSLEFKNKETLDKNGHLFYHLLTYSNKFTKGTQVFDDYNSFIDL